MTSIFFLVKNIIYFLDDLDFVYYIYNSRLCVANTDLAHTSKTLDTIVHTRRSLQIWNKFQKILFGVVSPTHQSC